MNVLQCVSRVNSASVSWKIVQILQISKANESQFKCFIVELLFERIDGTTRSGGSEMAPETPSWLNLDFTERVLRFAENDSTVQVIDIFIKPATNKGDNYTSDMMRVVVEFTRKHMGKKVNEKKSLIFKFEPIVEGARKDMIEKTEIFDTEIIMMMGTLKKMNEMLGPGNRLGAQVFHVRMERPLCLIMEDLAALGFRMVDRQAGLDRAHCMLAIRGLAKFHASSVALCEKEPEHKRLYRKGMFSEEFPQDMSSFFVTACLSLATEVETWPEFGKRYADKIRAFAPQLYKVGIETVKHRDDEFNVINHGDSWVNNMLFRYDDRARPIEHIFVDFQLCIYTSPAIDLHYFLSTSPSEEVYENCMDAMLHEYLITMTSTMKQLRCKTPPPTMDQIKKTMRERAVYAFISSATVLPLVLVDKSQVREIDEMLPNEDGSVDNPSYKNPIYRRVMSKRLPKYMELGLLDVPV
ncbi:uncharacterized protein LOC143153098 isoform X2 [Ptiloglossa arizonensis]|uniref:uncharacterized protein LOC143153098 isoform X2 n=1 Tax=Ptiloglossa arizonensis TaxID=3350558 RepID=UPI003FA10587